MFFRFTMGKCMKCNRNSDGFEFKINPLDPEPLFYCCCDIHAVVSHLREAGIIKPDKRAFTWPELFVVESPKSVQAVENAVTEVRAIGNRQREYFPTKSIVDHNHQPKRLSN